MEIVRSVPFNGASSGAAAATCVSPDIHHDSIELEAFEKEVTGPQRILVFDSDYEAASTISDCLPANQFELTYCRSQTDLIDYVRRARVTDRPFELLLWGLGAPYEAGLSFLQEMRSSQPSLRVVLLAPQEALAYAPAIKAANVEAFILKPLHSQDVKSGVERALRKSRGNELPSSFLPNYGPANSPGAPPNSLAGREEPPVFADGRDLGLIGASLEMKKVITLIRKIGTSNVNVLITGESGSGKEMVANAIHRVSDRFKKPFIAINCAAIPRDLLESELFGHAKGAFTGATTARRGLFEEAHEGTILLDEIGDLPLPLQAKILRLLQTRQVKPLGQNTSREVDVRIISATHKNLKTLIQKGEFREDLYYRLNVMPIHLPALRDRKDDILPLSEHFLRRYAERRRGPVPQLSKKAQIKLMNLPWKGNVRELENVIERAIVLSDGISIGESEVLTEEMEPVHVTAEDLFNAGLSLKDIEREYIKYVLSRTGNRKEAATRILGIDRKTLYRKEKVYGIRPAGELN